MSSEVISPKPHLWAPPISCRANSDPALATISVILSSPIPFAAITTSSRERKSRLTAGTISPASVEYSPGGGTSPVSIGLYSPGMERRTFSSLRNLASLGLRRLQSTRRTTSGWLLVAMVSSISSNTS